MYEFIEGILEEKMPDRAILHCHGVGYLLSIPLNCFHSLPQLGQPLRLYTSFIVREDAHRLFGFTERAERDLFNTLKEISGIGPKTALSLIGHLDRHQLFDAVHASNATLIAKVPGIGKKTAERLIVELRDKKMQTSLPLSPLSLSSEEQVRFDAISALISLGYSAHIAERAIDKTLKEGQHELSTLITRALQQI